MFDPQDNKSELTTCDVGAKVGRKGRDRQRQVSLQKGLRMEVRLQLGIEVVVHSSCAQHQVNNYKIMIFFIKKIKTCAILKILWRFEKNF